MESRTLYDILGVSEEASENEIKKAYLTGVRDKHPDRGGDPEEFKEFHKAYEILKDENKRSIYDRFGEKALKDDIMDRVGEDHHSTGNIQRAEDIHEKVEVTLEELYNGITKEIVINRTAICSDCKGEGGDENAEKKICEKCGGKGKFLVNLGIFQGVSSCDVCDGKGKTFASMNSLCSTCNGIKVVPEEHPIKVEITKGMRYGKFGMMSEGNQAPDMITGAVVITVKPPKEEPSKMKLTGENDLLLVKDIPLVDSLLGCEFSFRHLNGKDLIIKVKGAEIISPGEIYKMEGYGMPVEGNPDSFGDLFIQFNIIFPNKISEEQKEHLKRALGPSNHCENDGEVVFIEKQETQGTSSVSDDEEEQGGPSCVQQ